jgi:hypothetical protein
MINDNLIFIHIPKAAGQTFHKILDKIFKNLSIFNSDSFNKIKN